MAIHLLIVGTHTPFLLVSIRNQSGVTAPVIIWCLATIGLSLDILMKKGIEWLQLSIYLAMGWLCITFYSSLQANVPAAGMTWLKNLPL